MSKSNAWRPFTFLANIYIALMAVYLALFTDYNHLLPLKLISFYAFGGGFVALTLLLSLESIAIGMVKPKELLKKLAPSSAVQWCLLGYLVFSLVSALLSQYPQTWIGATRYEGFLTVAIYTGSFYFLAKFARPEKWMMYAFGAAATVFGVIAVLQLAGVPLLYADGMNYYSGGSINSADYLIGTIGNIDFSAALLALVFPVITQSSLPRYGGYVRGERLTPMPGSSVDETLTESASAVYFLNEDSAAHAGEVPNMGQSYDYGYSTYFSWDFGSEQYFESLKDIYSIERIRPSINETTISRAPSGAYVYKSNKELKLFGDNMEIYLGRNKLEKEYVYGVGDQYILKANTEYYIVIDGGKFDDSVDDLPPFTDVAKGKFYYEPVIWAVDNGITSGTGDGTTFSPDMICTRAQVVTFLWRAKGSPEPQSSVNPFVDVKTGSYFHKAVLWAVEQGITNGTGDGTTFSPDMECTRAQVATFLWRTVGKPDVGNKTHPFRDIEAGSYYYDAVLWAVEAGVTNGTGDGTTFSPNKSCSRSEIVTFLYRALK